MIAIIHDLPLGIEISYGREDFQEPKPKTYPALKPTWVPVVRFKPKQGDGLRKRHFKDSKSKLGWCPNVARGGKS